MPPGTPAPAHPVSMPSDISIADVAIVAFVGLHVLDDLRRGFLAGLLDLVSVLAGVIVALLAYGEAAPLLVEYARLPYAYAKPAAFGLAWLVTDVLLAGTLRRIMARSIADVARSGVGRSLGIATGAARGLFVATLLLGIVEVLPLPGPVAGAVQASRIALPLRGWVERVQQASSGVVDDAVRETIGLLTVRPRSTERVRLPFAVADARIEPAAEQKMLELVNGERERAGLPPLVLDPAVREVARAYAQALFRDGYFSHVDVAGRDPFDRMRLAGIRFGAAGENLALAPTVAVAHAGLMESPGHRANILNARFRRVGIGAADGGLHGMIFTQEFTD